MLTAWDMWQDCNEALHKLELNSQMILEADINRQITDNNIQDKVTTLSYMKGLMKRPLKHLLQLLAYYKLQWMATVAAVKANVEKPNRYLVPRARPSVSSYL